ncbi:MAG: hypothetical protein IPM96_21720 [Ignavibacteria bacterium]|nr:hypothetical protein [Ignavibacteria bacterium]
MKSYFIPSVYGDLDSFEENFVNKLAIHAQAIGLDQNEVAQMTQTINEHRAAYSGMISKKAESKSATEINNIQRDKAVAEIRRAAKLIKSSKGYNAGIGNDLGIIGSDQPSKQSASMKPELKATLNGNEVVIKFRKEGTDGIKIFGRRGNENDFMFLAVDTSSPYNDTREKLEPGKPEQREYYAFFFEVDSEIGQASDVLKIVVP